MRARSNSRRRQSSADADLENIDENVGGSLLLMNKSVSSFQALCLVSGVLPKVPIDELPDCEEIELDYNATDLSNVTHTLSLGTIPTLKLVSGERIGNYDSLAMLERVNDRLSREIFENDSQSFGVFVPDDAEDSGKLRLRVCCICQEKICDPGYFANGMYMHINCATCRICGADIVLPKCVFFKDFLTCTDCAVRQENHRMCSVCGMCLDGLKEVVHREETDDDVHANCFRCVACGARLGSEFSFVRGEFCCDECVRNAKVCAKCGEPVLVDGARCHGKWYHRDHVQCSVCGCGIAGNCCVAHHNRLYCMEHGSIYNQTCSYCKGDIDQLVEDVRRWRGKMYHDECFVCRVCSRKLKGLDVKAIHNRPHCTRCADMRLNDGSAEKHRHIPSESDARRHAYEERCNEKFEYPEYTEKNERMLYMALKRPEAQAPKAEDLTFTLRPV